MTDAAGPEREARARSGGSGEWKVTIAPGSAFFRGHFPGLPIFPGIALLHDGVIPRVRSLRPDLGGLRRLERIKFRRPIAPSDELDVCVSLLEEPGVVELRVTVRGELCVSGLLRFEQQ